jgi:hypothetical protein
MPARAASLGGVAQRPARVWQTLGALKGRLIQVAVRLRASDAEVGILSQGEMPEFDALSWLEP